MEEIWCLYMKRDGSNIFFNVAILQVVLGVSCMGVMREKCLNWTCLIIKFGRPGIYLCGVNAVAIGVEFVLSGPSKHCQQNSFLFDKHASVVWHAHLLSWKCCHK